MTRAQLDAMHKALHKAHRDNLDVADKYPSERYPEIWCARMAAAHVALMLAETISAAYAVTPSSDPYDGK